MIKLQNEKLSLQRRAENEQMKEEICFYFRPTSTLFRSNCPGCFESCISMNLNAMERERRGKRVRRHTLET